jgi:hypothetical protein
MNIINTKIISGDTQFNISETTMKYGDTIFNKSFKLGGDYNNCMTISIQYNNGNPISAKIPYIEYEPECSIGSDLKKGSGTINMVKTLIRYVYKQTGIKSYIFDDMAHIECSEDQKEQLLPPRKIKKPFKLSYLSIAYHDKTWYELNYNAEMVDENRYKRYREKIQFLTDSNMKVDFFHFLEISQMSVELIDRIEKYYNNTNTYRDFFNSIPKRARCALLFPWLITFMSYYLEDTFNEKDWVINVDKLNKNKGGRRKTLKN